MRLPRLFLLAGILYGLSSQAQNLDSINRVTSDYCQQGQYDKALVHAFKAETLIASIAGKNSMPYLRAVFNIGTVYYLQNDFGKAEPYFERSYNLLLTQPNFEPSDLLVVSDAFANCAIRQRHYQKAYTPLFLLIYLFQKAGMGNGQEYFSRAIQFGMVLYETNKPDSSNLFLEPAIKFLEQKQRTRADSMDLDIGYRYAGIFQYSRNNFTKSIDLFEKALTQARQLYANRPVELLYYLKYLGLSYSEEKKYTNAIKNLEEAIAIARNWKQPSSTLLDLSSPLADALRLDGQFEKAIPLYEAIVRAQKSDSHSSPEDLAYTLHALGFCQISANDPINGEINLEESIQISLQKLHTDSLELANQFYNLSRAYIRNGKKQKAVDLIALLLPIYEKVHQKQSSSYYQLSKDLAAGYTQLKQYAESDQQYVSLIQLAGVQFNNPSKEIADLYRDKANNLMAGERFTEAIGDYQQSATMYKLLAPSSEMVSYASVINSMGLCYLLTGNAVKAESLIREALAIIERSEPGSSRHADALTAMGLLFDFRKDFISSVKYHRKSFQIKKKISETSETDLSEPFLNLFSSLENAGHYQEADSLLLTDIGQKLMSAQDNTETSINVKSTLGWSYTDRQQYSAAIMLFSNALSSEISLNGEKTITAATCLYGRGFAYSRSGNELAAFDDLKKSIAIIRQLIGDHNNTYINASQELARVLVKASNFADAELGALTAAKRMLEMLRNNFASQNQQEKLYWYKRVEEIFNLVPAILELDPHPGKLFSTAAFNQQIVNKGFVLHDDIKTLQTLRNEASKETVTLLDSWQSLKTKLVEELSKPLASRKYSIDSLQSVIEETEQKIADRSMNFRKNWATQNSGFRELQASMNKDEVAIEFLRYRDFYTGEPRYGAFVVNKNDSMPRFLALCQEDAVKKLLQPSESGVYTASLYRGAKEGARPAMFRGDSLYKLIWSPLEPYLQNKKSISLSPAGLLNRVSFAAMANSQGIYLIDQYEIRTYTTLMNRMGDTSRSNALSKKSALLAGGINYNSKPVLDSSLETNIVITQQEEPVSWKELPGTISEMTTIDSLLRPAGFSNQLLSGDSAGKIQFSKACAQSPAIIHIATHGFFLSDEENKPTSRTADLQSIDPMMRCGLVFAGANQSAGTNSAYGILTAYEISQLDLSHTDLVVVSACETALGNIEGAEGVFGLQRAFKIAGASKMILSLWQVPDKETAELMTAFYRQYLSGMDARKAFLEAQQQMRKKYSPYYWAAFIFTE